MKDQDKQELLKKLEFRERIVKGKLQFYVRYRLEIPEGLQYADNQINNYLTELRELWDLRKQIQEL